MTARPQRRPARRVLIALAGLLVLQASPARAASSSFGDVPRGYWAGTAIRFVAESHRWMRDFGTDSFKPKAKENRERLARAVVRAFAPSEPTDPSIHFDDLPSSDPFFRFANVAVKLGWIPAGSSFHPTYPVTTVGLHRTLVLALGLEDVVDGINAIHTSDGYRLQHPSGLGYLLTGMLLGLRYDHDNNSLDVGPSTRVPRSEVAWSLYRAYVANTTESWRKTALVPYESIRFRRLDAQTRRVVEFGLRYIAYPYVYAGEWNRKSPSGYCCGYQSRGGFDCSGLVWWAMKAPQSGYDVTKVRPYRGWPLAQRSSRDMAGAIPKGQRLALDQVRPGDLMFYDGSGDGVVDHVDLYLGRGWGLDSSNGAGGVLIVRVKSGWYRDHFKWGRDIIHTG
jgi:hypothetical protein